MVDFKVDGDKATLYFGVEDLSLASALFKSHRDYINAKFQQHGFEVTKWNWDVNMELPPDPITGNRPWVKHLDGLDFKTTDNQTDMLMEVIGTIGVNIRRIR